MKSEMRTNNINKWTCANAVMMSLMLSSAMAEKAAEVAKRSNPKKKNS